MANPTLAVDSSAAKSRASRRFWKSLFYILKYTLTRGIALFITIIIAVYLTILIANMGGHTDTIRKSGIKERVLMEVAGNPALVFLTQEERENLIKERIRLEEESLGLDKNFFLRSLEYLKDGITLDLAYAEHVKSDSGSKEVRAIITERLFPTLLLFASAQIAVFFISVFTALFLSRRYGSLLDKIVIALAPTSAAPSWFYGIFVILIFAAILGVLPFGGMVEAPPPQGFIPYTLSLLEHLILPVSAIFIGSIFQTIYYWRTFFLIYSSEDYVEMAKAKGLTSRAIERRYILRPTMPTIITSFALMLISVWTGQIVLETVFNWPGLGNLIYQATQLYDTPVVVGSVVIFAYLLGLTVFFLDIVYALIDPRVKIGSGGRRA